MLFARIFRCRPTVLPSPFEPSMNCIPYMAANCLLLSTLLYPLLNTYSLVALEANLNLKLGDLST